MHIKFVQSEAFCVKFEASIAEDLRLFFNQQMIL